MSRLDRATAGLLLAAVLAGCGADEPGTAAPSPSTSSTAPSTSRSPAPTTPSPSPTTSTAPPVDQATGQAYVDSFRFPVEGQWAGDVDFPPTVETSRPDVHLFGCEMDAAVPGPLATRLVSKPGAESGSLRGLSVLADPATAAEVFANAREQMRGCHGEVREVSDGAQTTRTTFVGEQLELGDESFWVGQREVVLNPDGTEGQELFYSTAALYVLDGATITVVSDPAYDDATRAAFVQAASAEWEQLRPSLEAYGR